MTAVPLERALAELEPTPAAYARVARQLDEQPHAGLRPFSVVMLASFTADLLKAYVAVESARVGLAAQVRFGPFNQFEQQVLDGASVLRREPADGVIVAFRLEDLSPRLTAEFLCLTESQIEEELGAIDARIDALLASLVPLGYRAVLVFNFAPPLQTAAGLADPVLARPEASVIARANERLAAIVRKHAGCHVLDFARVVSEVGVTRWYDRRLWFTARTPFGVAGQIATGRAIARCFRAALVPPCKCLVLDLDGTLWGGVLGEDGLDGIQLGAEYPGSVFKGFQQQVLKLRQRGVLLAVASKNDESEALDAMARHPDCLLKPHHFAAMQIHWGDKAMSLREIARTLNIGVDALAFFDDNPVERSLVRSQEPDITVIEVPVNPLEYASALVESMAFDQLEISAEDRSRAVMYQTETRRQALQARSGSIGEFLRELDMRVTIGAIDAETQGRVAQLLAKTNQFNLTTRRHKAADVQDMLRQGAVGLWARVEDRFGDGGLVGVVIAVPNGPVGRWRIDSFLLSCRVIGRQVEVALLSAVSDLVQSAGATELVGEYVPTAKNSVCRNFYESVGFARMDEDGRYWSSNLQNGVVPTPTFMTVIHADERVGQR